MEKMEEHLQEFNPEDITLDVDSCEVGNGSFGVVLLGQHKVFSLVALKCFSLIGSKRQKKKVVQRIHREFHLMRQASHECIARVYGWAKRPFNMAIVMEYCPGGNLRELLADESVEIGMVLRLRFAIEIASGLAVIHNLSSISRLIHGDLKPENVLFSQSLHCKITDFDCARLASYTGSTTTWEKSFSDKWHMTMQYAAPEIFDNFNLKPAKKQDAYSYAVVLYVIVTRKLPYYNITDPDGFKKAVKGGLRPDCSCLEALEASLLDEERVIVHLIAEEMRRCWENKPSSRPDLISVRDRLQNCFADYDPAVVAEQVAVAVKDMQLDPPCLNQEHEGLAYLHQFSAETRTFHNVDLRQQGSPSSAIAHKYEAPNPSHSDDTTLPKQVNEHEGNHATTSTTVPKLLQGSDMDDSTVAKVADGGSAVGARPSSAGTLKLADLISPVTTEVAKEVLKALEEYKAYTKTQNWLQADEILSRLATTIQRKFETSAEELKKTADRYRFERKFSSAQAFYKLAADRFANVPNQSEAAVGIRMCVGGLKENNATMMNLSVIHMEALRHHSIPIMKQSVSHIQAMGHLDEHVRVLNLAWCIQFIVYCLLKLRDFDESKAYLEQAIDMMKGAFGQQACKYHVLGHCVANLGTIYTRRRQFEESLKRYDEAWEIYTKAEDISEEYRSQVLQKCVTNAKNTRALRDGARALRDT